MRSLICFVVVISLTACGGGGGGGSSASPSPPPAITPPAGIPNVNPPGATRIAYGADGLQFGDLRIPAASFGPGPYPVAVVVHGGCWTSGVGTLVSSASLADALTKRGIATWNIEYRAIGDAGGGYPGTFHDWSAATDYVRTLAATYPLDLSRVVLVGHSAGAHGALWLAARKRIAAGSELAAVDPLPVKAVVALDGPGELRPSLGYSGLCNNAAERLLGGTPEAVPDRFRQASPSELLPLGVPQYLVSATFLTPGPAARYRDMAVAKGDMVTIIDQSSSGHFEMVTPGRSQELEVENTVVGIVGP
ncbi:hypothetical protein ABAC460_02685 [Asticcacaulis sp. AC460]|uniref:alpha/beta hydrolase n=1 Tax=Asticcacaulis sp. AC460 TaxID=1282360 RepID=UPI0003C3E029|nr:alpha/beta hydrolase [Asticcacaulis sp. AC460]ESQ92756.1 hypothetical protein ABAC460_02685 [Asticcacaulis sp. AC460]